MLTKKLLSAALLTGSLLMSGVASAATLVTLNPTATNGGAGALSADPAFQAVGFQSNLYSSLVISGNSGVQTFSETGYIDITSFNDGNTVASGVGTNYHIFGYFTITGGGAWVGNSFFASTAGLSLTVNLVADPGAIGGSDEFSLGTATLAPGFAFAMATALGSTAPNESGDAFTTLSANMNFTPAAGTTGVGGFFEAPTPFNLNLSIGNAGGNSQNTAYSVDSNGVVTIVTPKLGPNINPGTANVTFVQPIPEPGALSLVALGLIGAGIATRRKIKAMA